jgi:hypothetical protein
MYVSMYKTAGLIVSTYQIGVIRWQKTSYKLVHLGRFCCEQGIFNPETRLELYMQHKIKSAERGNKHTSLLRIQTTKNRT